MRAGAFESNGREAILLRAVSVVEAFVDALLLSTLNDSFDAPDVLLDRLIAEVEVSSSSGWPSRRGAYKRLCELNLRKVEKWRELEAATEVRNAIAHGLGRLTARQRRDVQIPTVLLRIGVHISGGELRLSDSALRAVVENCQRFVRSLDADLSQQIAKGN